MEYFGDIPQIALISSKCKRGQSELSQEARIEILAELFKNLKILPVHSHCILLHSDINNKYEAKIQLLPTFSKREFTPSALKCSIASLKDTIETLVS
jgi:hypothetical protein